MAERTSPEMVRSIIQLPSSLDLSIFIASANALTNQVEANDTRSVLSEQTLQLIETWLAAHFASVRVRQLKSETTDGASASYQELYYWQQAVALDTTGYLSTVNQKKTKAGGFWAGTASNC